MTEAIAVRRVSELVSRLIRNQLPVSGCGFESRALRSSKSLRHLVLERSLEIRYLTVDNAAPPNAPPKFFFST